MIVGSVSVINIDISFVFTGMILKVIISKSKMHEVITEIVKLVNNA
jgi:hypothetical protein